MIAFLAKQNITLEFNEKIAPALGVSYRGKIALLPGQSKAEEFTTLVHETAHELLHKAERRTLTTATVDELFTLAEEKDGLFTSKEARSLGILDSVLVRLRQRGRLERMSRGVYRIAHYPAERLAQYRESILWAQASNGPERVALSHETALLLYGFRMRTPPM